VRENVSEIARNVVFSRWSCALLSLLPIAVSRTATAASSPAITIPIYSASPAPLALSPTVTASAIRDDEGTIRISNPLLSAEISARTGVVRAIDNRVTNERHVLVGDVVGVNDWTANEATPRQFKIALEPDRDDARIVLEDRASDQIIRITYDLAARNFWLQRRITVTPETTTANYNIDRLTYGRLHIDGGERKVLALGKFDRPSIVTVNGKGGLFAGVGHWFYQVADDGTFANAKTNWQQSGAFESEPWYIGVFATETGEPYAGWSWYHAYLERSKAAARKHATWFSWNAGWGQWGIDIDDSTAGPYLELMNRLGINGVIFGGGGFGKGIEKFNDLAATDPTTKSNLALLKKFGIAGGTLNNGSGPWEDAGKIPGVLDELNHHVAAGFRATAFDFFQSRDTYAAHRRVSQYFRRAQEKLDYTECHLGMAAYGPQFQQMVRVNHPDDIHGFDISHFSANWATFLAFRQSRRNWQRKYEYLMPEDGLYYYLTHYANWGNPRRYTDPEPQQFLWSVPAYCGIGFNFHDTFGWRESIAAASAFTTAPVFGHIELKMPPRDEAYAKEFFAWMKDNAAILATSRVCAETETYCVVSKIASGKGLVYIVNYHPGEASFSLPLKTGHAGTLAIRQVYPTRDESRQMKDGDELALKVRGESTAIFEVNAALKSLPPENRSRFPIDLALARERDDVFIAQFTMPDVRDALKQATDPALPGQFLSLDQVQDTRPDLMVNIAPDKDGEKTKPAVKWIGKGKLPQPFLDVYNFKNGQTVETWKIVPWAYADRVWLVVRPDKPVPLAGPHPTATINRTATSLVPRVDHRFKEVLDWNCPLYHADITDIVRFGQTNNVTISIPGQQETPIAYILSAADRN
jgi:hypothetical protein